MSPVDDLIKRFGGLREAQRKLGEKHGSTLQSWQKAGRIPHFRRAQIRDAAEKHNIDVPDKLWRQLFPAAEAA
jgi:hypothetical protein